MDSNRKARAGNVVAKVMSILPGSFLANLELAAQLGQGKSWGTSTVREEVDAVLAALAPSARDRLVIADVGGNVGDWSAAFVAAAPGAKIHTFEPSSVAFARLNERFATNPDVTLVNAAVGAEDGTATLWSDAPGSVLGSLEHRRLDHHDLGFDCAEEVRVVSLDSYFADEAAVPSVLKLDVEGREFDVLRGAERTLRKVDVVQFEFGGCNIDSRTYFQDFWYFFRDAGFRVHRLGPRGPREMRGYSEADECFRTTNFLAVRT